VAKIGQSVLKGLLLAAKLCDPLGDELRLDPLLEGLDLGLDLSLELRDLLAHPGPGELAAATLLAVVGPNYPCVVARNESGPLSDLGETHRLRRHGPTK
jgi:hypothetical protein